MAHRTRHNLIATAGLIATLVLVSCGEDSEPVPAAATAPPAVAAAPTAAALSIAPTQAASAPAAAQTASPTPAITESTATPAPPPTRVPPAATAVSPAATAVPPPPTATTAPLPEGPRLASSIASFTLEDLTVSVGTTVTWTNQDRATHTATSGTPRSRSGVWDSGNLGLGGQFSFTFTEAGTFQYFCRIHNSMTGTVTVTEPGAAAVPTPTATAVPPTPVPPAPTPTTPPPAPEPQAVASNIANFQLENLTVNAGTTVTWTNQDGAPHTATSGTPSSPSGVWDSGILSQTGQYSFTFAETGTFQYFCDIHNSMRGTVTVVESGASSLVAPTPASGGESYGE